MRQGVVGDALWRYVMMARHSGSMEGRSNAEPQTCRSSVIVL
jgi:hypothetical protein